MSNEQRQQTRVERCHDGTEHPPHDESVVRSEDPPDECDGAQQQHDARRLDEGEVPIRERPGDQVEGSREVDARIVKVDIARLGQLPEGETEAEEANADDDRSGVGELEPLGHRRSAFGDRDVGRRQLLRHVSAW